MTIGIIIFAILCLVLLFIADGGNKHISLPVSAGKIDAYPKNPTYHKTELLTTVDGEVISSYQKNIQIGRVYGNSVRDFDGGISNNDLFFADSDIPVNDLIENDIILLSKKKSNGEIFYKLRCFKSYNEEDNTIKTLTSVNGVVKLSNPHLLGNVVDDEGDKHLYIGCVVANIRGYYNKKTT